MKPRSRRERMLVSYASKLLNESFGLMTEGTSKRKRTGDNNRDGNIGEFITGYALGTGIYTVGNIQYYKNGSDKLDTWMKAFMKWAKGGNNSVPDCWVVEGKRVVLNTKGGWKVDDKNKIEYPNGPSKKSWMACLLMATHENGEYRGMAPGPADEGANLAEKIKQHFIDEGVYQEADFNGGLPYDSLLWPAVVGTAKFGFDKIEQADIIVLGKGKNEAAKKRGAMGYSLKVGGSTAGQANLGAADYFAEYQVDSTAVVSAGVLAFLKQAVEDLWSGQSEYFSGEKPSIDKISDQGLTVTKRRKSDVCSNGKLLEAINAKLKTKHKKMSDLDEMPDWDTSYGIKFQVDGEDKTLKRADYNQLKAVHKSGIAIVDGGVRKVDRSLADAEQAVKVGEISGNVTTHIGKALASCAVQLFTAPGSAKDLVDKIISMSGVFGTKDKGEETDVTYCVSPKPAKVEHPTHVYPGIYIACSDADPNNIKDRIPKTLDANDFQWAKEDGKNTVYIGYNDIALMKLSIRTSSPSGSVFTATATVSPYGKLVETAAGKEDEIDKDAPNGTDWQPVGSTPNITDEETETEIAVQVAQSTVNSSSVENTQTVQDSPDVQVDLASESIPFKTEGGDGVSDQTLSMTLDGDLKETQTFLSAIRRHSEMNEKDAALGIDTKGKTLKDRVAAIIAHIRGMTNQADQQKAMRQVMGSYYEEAGIPFQERVAKAWAEFSKGETEAQFGSFPAGIKAQAKEAGVPSNVGDMMEWWITHKTPKEMKLKLAQSMTPQQIKAMTKDGRKYNKEDFEKAFVAENRRKQFVNLVNETLRTVMLLEGDEGEDTLIDDDEAIAGDFSYTDTRVFAKWLLDALKNMPEEKVDNVLGIFTESNHRHFINEARWLKIAGIIH